MAEHLSAEPEEVLTSLLGLLENEHPRVRLYAAEALHRSFDPHRAWSTNLQESRLALFKGGFGDSEMSPIYIALAEGAVPVLARALEDDQPFLRAHAAATLGKLGVDAADAGPALRNRLEDNDPIVRFWVKHALGRVEPPAYANLLLLRNALLESGESSSPLELNERDYLARCFEESSEWDPEGEGWLGTEAPKSPNVRFEAAKKIVLCDLPLLMEEAAGRTQSLRENFLLS